jgi:methyl-accepting chemotaxis protein
MSVDSPARPVSPDPPPRLADRPQGRQGRRGSPLALRNWPVTWRLIALIAIPTVVAMAFAGLRVTAAAGSAANFGRSAQLAALGQQVTGLAQAMEDERDLTANFIAADRPAADRPALQRQYAVTDAWAQRVGAQMRDVGGAFPAQTQTDAAAVMARIADLRNLRSYAAAGHAPALAVITNYSLALADLFTFDDAIAQQAGSAGLVGRVRTLGSLSRMKDQASQQRAILEAALASRQFQPGTLDALTAAQAQQAADLASFGTAATLAESQALGNTVAGRPVDLARALEQRAIVLGSGGRRLELGPRASQQWYSNMSYTIGRMRQAERQLSSAIVRQANALHQGAMRSLMLTAAVAAAVLIIVLLATVVIARSMVRPLRQLKAGALEVAGARLPEEVRELSTAGGADQGAEVEPIGVHSTDEIGQVARAFDQVHQEAVRLAADEARLRGSVSAMFVSLSRRSGSLLERLLRLIDSLELGEQDSERLADLFRMDHLATRMRRNSENLLVLAGQEPPRRWAEPVSLADVVRASVSEIEQYDRVVLDMQPGLAITGNAVADTVHLLAEIIENATSFSAKGTQVAVSGHSLRSGGVLISVIDSGMGMTEDQLAQVNWRLENPPVADVEVSRHMGLFAVAHLAERHGIRVRLKAATGGGLIARVWLPGALISHDGNPASWDHVRTRRASAMIQAVTRTARFPQDPSVAAAASLAGAPFAAAPLADMTLATPPWEALHTTEPLADKPAATPPEETPWTSAPPEEAPRAATPADEMPTTPADEMPATTRADEMPAITPADKMPAATPPEEEPRTTALAAETPATAPEDEPDAGPPVEEQPRTTAPAAETPATTPPDEEPHTTTPADEQPHTTTPADEQPHTTTPADEQPGTTPADAPVAEMPADAPPEETARVVVPTPRQRPREARLPIFEAVESDWFRARRTAPAHAGATVDPHGAERSWISPGDEGWRAAETILAPAVGGITPSGLPRRTPKANLVPGSAGAREDRPARAADSADVVSKRLAGFQRGSRRARDAPGAQSPGEQE